MNTFWHCEIIWVLMVKLCKYQLYMCLSGLFFFYLCCFFCIRDEVQLQVRVHLQVQVWVQVLCDMCYIWVLLKVKWCLGADRRNPDRHGGAFIKGSMAPAPPQPPQGSTAWPIYLYQGQREAAGGGGGGTGVREEERLHGQVLLHMPGGMAGASHRGILLKVRQADLPVTSAWGRYWACVSVS